MTQKEEMHVFSSLVFCMLLLFSDFCLSTPQLPQKPSAPASVVYSVLRGGNWGGPTCCCSVTQTCPTLCNPMDCSTPGFPVLHCLPEFARSHVHWVDDASQPSHLLPPPSPLAFSLSQHQGPFQWVGCFYQVAKVLEFQLQHQSFQWMFRVDFL